MHGGIISALLDEAMVKVALMQKMPAITAELNVRFKNPLVVGDKAIVEAAITKINKRIIEVAGIMKKNGDTTHCRRKCKTPETGITGRYSVTRTIYRFMSDNGRSRVSNV